MNRPLSITKFRTFDKQSSRTQRESTKGKLFEPLPQESSISVLWRFCWLNGYRSSKLSKLGIKTRFSRVDADVCTVAETTENLIQLEFPLTVESNIKSHLRRSTNLWFHSKLKLCPLCVGSGFHSIWHQFVLLEECPLHGCRLTSCCADCNAPLGHYECSFIQPYMCKRCARPFSGVMPEFEEMEIFREQKNSVNRAFAPFEQWLTKSASFTQRIIEAISSNPDWKRNWDDWGHPKEWLLSYACSIHPPPKGCRTPRYPMKYRELTYSFRPRKDHEWNTMRHAEIYATFLNDLRSWIERTPSTACGQKSYKFSIGFNNTCSESVNDLRLIAYAAFRTKFEFIDADHWNQAIPVLSFKEPIVLFGSAPRPDMPDQGVRLILLSVFSTILHLVQRHTDLDRFDMSRRKIHIKALLAFGINFVEEDKLLLFTLTPNTNDLDSLVVQGLSQITQINHN